MAKLVKGEAIKALLRHRVNGKYFAGPGLADWVEEPDQALAFASLEAVFREAKVLGFADCCEIVVEFENSPTFSVFLPL